MNRIVYAFILVGLTVSPLLSQSIDSSSGNSVPDAMASAAAPAASSTKGAKRAEVTMVPFSRIAFGGGIGVNGINMQAATNMSRYTNLRLTGGVFNYSVSDISTNGFTANGSLNLGAVGAAVDVFPFPKHGFRVSPGLLFYNDNGFTASATVNGGESFTLNDVDYYSSVTDPITASANLRLSSHHAAMTLTTGWGNMIPRRGGHWSFPVEIGAAFVGTPTLKMTLKGTACDAQGRNCVNAGTDPSIQENLNAQIGKYIHDLDALKVYPVFNVGVSYCFGLGSRAR